MVRVFQHISRIRVTTMMFIRKSACPFAGANGYYVTDTATWTVRRVTSAGMVTTLCGQSGTTGQGYGGDGGSATATGVNGGGSLRF